MDHSKWTTLRDQLLTPVIPFESFQNDSAAETKTAIPRAPRSNAFPLLFDYRRPPRQQSKEESLEVKVESLLTQLTVEHRRWRSRCDLSGLSGSEARFYSRLIDSCITQPKAQGPLRTCNDRETGRRNRAGCRVYGAGDAHLQG